jgi:hypothetical protein
MQNGCDLLFWPGWVTEGEERETMKRFIAVAMMSMLPALAFGQNTNEPQSDIRVINSRKVDLLPLHQWYENPEGRDRPLKHWMKLTLLDVKPVFAGSYLQCLVEIENSRREVLFKTLPSALKETVTRMQIVQTNLITLQQEIAEAEPLVRRNEAQYEGSVVRSRSYEIGPGFNSRVYEYERPTRRAVNARLDRVALEEKQQTVTRLQEELDALRQNTSGYTVFAMDTGRKFGGVPIWDTGLPAN